VNHLFKTLTFIQRDRFGSPSLL